MERTDDFGGSGGLDNAAPRLGDMGSNSDFGGSESLDNAAPHLDAG